ncbi:high mobility group box domain-containing protein [Gloeopeniophorella convolvens]|nr:high mobility group box domain-containing protein [Gloeopeniophorella convolvens]
MHICLFRSPVLPAPSSRVLDVSLRALMLTLAPQMPKEATKSKTRKAAEKAEKNTRSSRKKDPKAPKRALSAYMFFSQDWRERIKAENPDASFGEVGKLLGAKWKELDDDEKKPYIEQAARDKSRAEQEKTDYDNKNAGSGGDGDDDDE